jgi:multiple sugar transport system permease protein
MSAKRSVISKLRHSEAVFGYLLIAPLIVWLAATLLLPLGEAVRLSFTDAGIIGTSENYVGLRNYRDILAGSDFWPAAKRSAVWALGNALLQVSLGFGTALVLKRAIRGGSLGRTLVILPWIIPTVVLVIIWRWVLSGTFGVVNYVLQRLGLIDAPKAFFGDVSLAMPSLIFVNSWRWFPFLTLILLAGLQRVPRSEYEAAAIDGASGVQQFRFITFGYLRPLLVIMGLVGTLWSVNVFDIVWLLTQGGPSDRTQTLPVLIYNEGFKAFAMGKAAAQSMLFLLLMLGFIALYLVVNFPGSALRAVKRRPRS